jgi:hypothetical protein
VTRKISPTGWTIELEPAKIGMAHPIRWRTGKDIYVGALIRLWLFQFPIFLFAAQLKEFFLDGLKKLEQPSHKCVELRGNM